MRSNHTVRRWRTGLKKALNDLLLASLPISDAPNVTFHKDQILRTILECVAHGEYPSSYTDTARSRGRHLPHGDTISYRLKHLPLPDVVRAAQQAIANLRQAALDAGLLTGPQIIALDTSSEPVYTKKDPSARGSAKFPGTKVAHEFLLGQTVKKDRTTGHLLPLGVRPWTPMERCPALAREILTEILAALPIALLLADRGFYAVDYFRLFLDLGIPFVVPLPENARNKREIDEARRKSRHVEGRTETVFIDPAFVLEKGDGRESVTITVVYVFRPDEARKRPGESDRPEHFLYATSGLPAEGREREALARMDAYDHRWGIEVGLREQDAVEGKTRSERPAVQWLFHL